MPVVGNYDESALEILQILLQNVDCHDVQVVGRFIENQQVRLFHQYCQKVESPALPSA